MVSFNVNYKNGDLCFDEDSHIYTMKLVFYISKLNLIDAINMSFDSLDFDLLKEKIINTLNKINGQSRQRN